MRCFKETGVASRGRPWEVRFVVQEGEYSPLMEMNQIWNPPTQSKRRRGRSLQSEEILPPEASDILNFVPFGFSILQLAEASWLQSCPFRLRGHTEVAMELGTVYIYTSVFHSSAFTPVWKWVCMCASVGTSCSGSLCNFKWSNRKSWSVRLLGLKVQRLFVVICCLMENNINSNNNVGN